jgi:hypothetical protein
MATELNTSKDTIETNTVVPSAQSSSSARNADNTSLLSDLNVEQKPKSKSFLILYIEETFFLGSIIYKRARNWSEIETMTFITVWSDHYSQIEYGGLKNAPIYNSMALQLNSMLSNRNLTGRDVKIKVWSLMYEYRKKKREQSYTGASPCKWIYFNAIDKLIRES